MGLRDAFRSRRSDRDPGDDAGTGGLQDLTGDEAEATWFAPRIDGEYVSGADASGGAAGGPADGLRFVPGGKVHYRPGVAGTGPWTGDYTGAGRFSVQAPFERPITFAVLELGPDVFTARRTDTRDRSAVTVTYRFDGPPAG